MDRQARKLISKREKDDRWEDWKNQKGSTKECKKKAWECPLKHYLTVQCLPVSNDEMEEGDPGSDSDFEIHTKKEVRHKLENND